MRHRELFSRRRAGARGAVVPLVLFALCAALIPSSRAQDGRPRRVSAGPRTVVTAQQQTTQPQPQTTGATPARAGARPTQTPTPAPTATPQTQTTGPRPKLQSQPSAQPDEPNAQADPNQEVDPEEVVRIESNETKLHVRVVDRFNRPVNDVGQGDLRVFENGVPQVITSFTKEEVPITYGLVVDNSGSLRNQINQVIEAAKTIVSSNKPGDETFVVRFISSDEIKIMQDFTADKQSLSDALDDMFVEGGQTAVIGSVNELEKERGFISKSKRDKAVSLLDRMAKETGGRTFYPTSLSELPGIADQITKDLRTQYVVSYRPASKGRPGEFRPVRV